MKILVAEDSTSFRQYLQLLLGNLGHEVVTAATGREAWDEFCRQCCPVVISDWQMPEIDGMLLTRMIRARPYRTYTYVILLTAYGGMENYVEGIRAGADDFLTKPLDERQLEARLFVAERIVRLQNHTRSLEGLLAVCSYCKQVRNANNEWVQMDQYLGSRTDLKASHTICATCLETRVKPELIRFGIKLDEISTG